MRKEPIGVDRPGPLRLRQMLNRGQWLGAEEHNTACRQRLPDRSVIFIGRRSRQIDPPDFRAWRTGYRPYLDRVIPHEALLPGSWRFAHNCRYPVTAP
jgi:hypothetical protein